MQISHLSLLGPPGSGKGTQSQKITEHYALTHVSAGDLLRAHVKQGLIFQHIIRQFTDRGALAPDSIVNLLMESWLSDKKEKMLFDGYPRTVDQTIAVEKVLAEKNQDIGFIIALEVPEEELLVRLKKRAQTAHRSDDQTQESIQNRLRAFQQETLGVVERYEKRDRAIRIDGTGSPEEVFDRIVPIMDRLNTAPALSD